MQAVERKIKSGKVPGLDVCDVECLKAGGVSVCDWLDC